MAVTKVRVGAVLTGVPGAYSTVDRTGLNQVGFGATGIAAVIGEADSGGAGGGTAIVNLNNPQDFLDTFRGGDLREVGGFLFNPSLDSDIPAGAQEVRAIRVNPATQASATLQRAAVNALVVTSADYGSFAAQINVQKGTGTTQGHSFTEVLETTTNVYDNIGGDAWFSLAYDSDAGAGYDTMSARINVDASANPNRITATGTFAQVGTIANAHTDNAVASATSANAGDNTQTLTIFGVDMDGVPVSAAVVLNGLGAVVTTQRFQAITGAQLSAVAAGTVTVTDGVDGSIVVTAGQLTRGLVLPTNAPVAGRSLGVQTDGNQLTRFVVIRGLDRNGNAQAEAVNPGNAADVNTQQSWTSITAIEVNDVDGARTVTVTGIAGEARITTASENHTLARVGESDAQIVSGNIISVVSSDAGDTTQNVTVYGETVAGAAQTEVLALNGVTEVPGTALWGRVYGAVVSASLVGALTVEDETTDTDILIGAAGQRRVGITDFYSLPINNATVSLVADGATTRRVRIVGLNSAGAAATEVVVLTGAVAVVTTTVWSRITRIDTGNVETARTVTLTISRILDGGHNTIQRAADRINAAAGFTFTIVTDAPTTDLVSELDVAGPSSILDVTVNFLADLTEIIRYVNERSTLVVLSRPDGAVGAPDNTAAAVFLSGGSNGTTTFAHWQAAINLLLGALQRDVNTIVVLTDSAAVHAALDAHLVTREGTLRAEANGFVGLPVGSTQASIQTLIRALNTRRLAAVAQEIQKFNSAGVSTWFPPYMLAALAAGAQSGAPSPATPLTRKYMNVLNVRQDSSWSPSADADTMLDSGLMFLEDVPARGIRWVRSITTYLQDTNLANIEVSVNHAVNVFIRDFREVLEDRVGAPAFAGTVAGVRGLAKSALDLAVKEGRIFSYQSLVVTLVVDRIEVSFEAAIVAPTNFIPITAHLVAAAITS